MWLIGLIFVGLVVGGLARLALPGPDPIGLGLTILIGIGGALVGGWLGKVLLGRPGGLILSVLVATGFVYLVRQSRRA